MSKSSHLIFSSLLTATAMIVAVGASGTANAAPSVVSADFCVDANHFRFLVDISEPDDPESDNVIAFQIGADVDPFDEDDTGDPTQKIAVNFERDTGLLGVTPALGPLVITDAGAPDPWLNQDPITDFTVTSIGGIGSGALRIEGSVPRGTEPFVDGDTVAGVAFLLILNGSARGDLSPDALRDVPIVACDNQVSDTAILGIEVVLGVGVIIEDFADIGDNVVLGDQVFIGRNAVIGDGTVLEDGAQIARDVVIGDEVQGLTILNTIFHPVVIDKGARVGDGTLLEGTEIGAGAIVGSDVTALSFVDPFTHDISVVTIERKAKVGDGATLDFGTFVGRGVTLGAGVSTATICNEDSDCFPTHFDKGATVGVGATLDIGTFVGSGVVLGDGVTTTTICTEDADCFPTRYLKGATVGARSSFGGNTLVEMKASIGTDAIIGADVVIGKHAVIGDTVTIGDGVIVPMGAVVPDFTSLP